MKEYWFYLESYTFLWVKCDNVLVYNSLSGGMSLFVKNRVIADFFKQFQNKESMYCLRLTDSMLEDDTLNSAIHEVRNSFSGDLVLVSETNNKPLIFPPILNFQRERNRLKKESKLSKEYDVSISLGDNVLKNIFEISIYINGHCTQHCATCETKMEQFPFCTKSNTVLSLQSIEKLLGSLVCKMPKINILGGDILLHPSFQDIVSLLNSYNVNQTYFFYYKNLEVTDNTIIGELNGNVKILFDYPLNMDAFYKVSEAYARCKNISYVFTVSSNEEFENIMSLISQTDISVENIELKPFYDGSNMNFMSENLFIDKDDFSDVKLNRKKIYAHQVLNTNDWGKLTILSDGTIYANVLDRPIGRIDDDIRLLVYKEMTEGKSWFRIRDQKPCCDCVYQWLCPSPSNYEMVLNKSNLCHIEL